MADSQSSTAACKKCGEEKPRGEFYTDRRRRSGISTYCKACVYTRVAKEPIACEICGRVTFLYRSRRPICGSFACNRETARRKTEEFRDNPENAPRVIAYSRASDARRLATRSPEGRVAKQDYLRRYATRPDRARRYFANQLGNLYGITLVEWDRMVVAQSGCCAICGEQFGADKKGAHVDHDHTHGRVRALLCGPCNVALGLFKEDADRLRNAADYITTHQANR